MTVPEEFRGYSPKEVAEITGGLYGEHELRRMAAHDEIAHHRGGRNKIVFFPDDIKALLRSTRRTPTKSRGQDTTPRTAPVPVVVGKQAIADLSRRLSSGLRGVVVAAPVLLAVVVYAGPVLADAFDVSDAEVPGAVAGREDRLVLGVLGVRDDPHVPGVHARPVTAAVVQHHAVGDAAMRELPGVAVGVADILGCERELAVPVSGGSSPHPAVGRLVHGGPEALLG